MIEPKRIIIQGWSFYEYEGEFYPEYLTKGNGMIWIKDKAEKYCKGKGLDIGAGNYCFPGAYAIDYGKEVNALKLDIFNDESMDYIFSSHCLEHLKEWKDALILWIKKLKKNGVLFLYLPHESMKLWRAGEPWGGAHIWIPTAGVLHDFLEDEGLEIVNVNLYRDAFWSFHIVARKV